MTKKKHIKDSERFSIVQDDMSYCFICKRYLRKGEGAIHEIFWGTANRQKSKDYELVVRLCVNHHDRSSPISVHHNPQGSLNKWLHEKGKEAFKREYPGEDFMKVFGRNYEVYSEED